MALQAGNIVGGDQAGRDINKAYYNVSTPRPSYIARLEEQFKHERANDIHFHSMVEKLQSFCSSVDGEGNDIIGLDEKLTNGNFQAFLAFARKTKEEFSKKLVRYQLYESAQLIYTYVLAEVFTRYHDFIYPLVQNGSSQDIIQNTVHDKIVVPIQERLEENVLDLLSDEINGALYFLTGNCHIKWE